MTILPKRNKRRLEQRDESSQQIVQSSGTTPLEVQTNTHSVQLQLQIDQPRPHSLNHTLSQSVHHGGHSTHQQTHSRYNQSNVYHSILHRSENLHSKPPVTTEPCKLRRRSPPIRQSTSDDSVHVHSKKSKRAKAKLRHTPYESQHTQDNHDYSTSKSQGAASSYVTFLPTSGASNSCVQTRQTLIPPPGNVTALISPKMPGGAQDTSGKGRRPTTPDKHVNSEDEYQNAPSPGGCNSEDEHVPSLQRTQHSEELERTFELALKKELGLEIKQMEMDGSCLFRAIADQVYGDQEMHDVVRSHCIDYMTKNADHFSHYVTEDFNTYLQRKKQLGCHGNHIEVQALSEMYNRPIEVYQYSLKPINIFHSSYRPESAFPIRLSYHGNTHYNSLIDPKKPTIGVGLGLPGFKPRMVEQNLLAEVKAHSENYQLEQTMLDDKLRETDWEITDETLQEQVARESYLQWLQDCQKRNRRPAACTVTGPSCSSGVDDTANRVEKLPPTGSTRQSASHSPKVTVEQKNFQKAAVTEYGAAAPVGHGEKASSSSTIGFTSDQKELFEAEPFTVYSYNGDIDENEAIARALAESQQDYIKHVIKKK